MRKFKQLFLFVKINKKNWRNYYTICIDFTIPVSYIKYKVRRLTKRENFIGP